ncbi:uncharacterized protein BP01DRAFT_355799 [Aspergillus saccharolyticus JOP 1030-1]|uniref:Uncharacterized protein n=1 Tax=Aspergillus saccharolyticus JOP 1030-1 TaxID=1450539 RepID=A0A318ZF24_9EURO|nr:hypothetical protein BP01DRAFT_355799 [Aspergillus saccharolyticus JOP 1030-1]PYH46151.1 hypothetical protein BP01DRAFT_355799 [Aspergillus saccharolyticus JOP 1030-1]
MLLQFALSRCGSECVSVVWVSWCGLNCHWSENSLLTVVYLCSQVLGLMGSYKLHGSGIMANNLRSMDISVYTSNC